MGKLTLNLLILFLVASVLPDKSKQQSVEFNLSLYSLNLLTDNSDYPNDEFQIWTPSSPKPPLFLASSPSLPSSSSQLPVKDIMSDNVSI